MNVDIAEIDAATCRSSAKRIASMISKFGTIKKDLVRDIGFGGILHMPQNNKVCRRFSVWLLRHIDVSIRSIVINQNIVIPIKDDDMKRILGIPAGSKKLFGLGKEPSEKTDFIRFAIGSVTTEAAETSCLKAAEQVLMKDYGDSMTHEETERFKVSFVVFVTGHFLVAKSRINHGSDDYWGALLETKKICQYNFCSMVIDEIMESATRVQAELKANKVVKYVSGCSLGLQVLYVDSFNLGLLSYPSPTIPRIALFDCETMTRMVKAIQSRHRTSCYIDAANEQEVGLPAPSTLPNRNKVGCYSKPHSVCTSEDSSNSSSKGYVAGVNSAAVNTMLCTSKKPAVTSYLTAYLQERGEKKLSNQQIDDLKWHNARMTLHVRKTKSLLTEGEQFFGPMGSVNSVINIHMEALMASIYQDNLRLAQRLHSHQQNSPCRRSIQQADSGSTTRVSGGSCNLRDAGNEGCALQVTHCVSSDLNSGTINGANQNKCPSNASSSSTGGKIWRTPIQGKRLFDEVVFSTAKRIKQEHNERPKSIIGGESGVVDYDFFASNKKKIACRQGKMAESPWHFGVVPEQQHDSPVESLYEWLQNNTSVTLQSYWIMHSNPRYIDLTGLDMKSIFIKRTAFTSDAFDIAVRRFNHLDLSLYGVGKNKCWRKSFESDFAATVLGGDNPLQTVSIVDQFTTASQFYDMSETRMLIVPALLDTTWCSYFWDMKDMNVHIFDPHADLGDTSSMDAFHNTIIDKLQKGLSTCIENLFEGWFVDWTKFKNKYVHIKATDQTGVSEGILTMVGMRDYDGEKIVHAHSNETLMAFQKMVMYEMLSIEGNYGKVPEGFVESIDAY